MNKTNRQFSKVISGISVKKQIIKIEDYSGEKSKWLINEIIACTNQLTFLVDFFHYQSKNDRKFIDLKRFNEFNFQFIKKGFYLNKEHEHQFFFSSFLVA